MVSEGLRPVIYIGSSGEVSPTIRSQAPLSKEAVHAMGEAIFCKINPKERGHIRAAHRLDRLSAIAGLQTTEGKVELLSHKDFRDWTNAGDTPQNPWRQLDLIGDTPETAQGFVNSYKMEKGNKMALLEHGILMNPKATGDEIEWFVPEELMHLEESAVAKHMSSRFQKKVYYIVHWTKDPTPEEITLMKSLGFTEAYSDTYEDEKEVSVCFYIDRPTYARVLLDKTAAT
jgi:hypothetical protein